MRPKQLSRKSSSPRNFVLKILTNTKLSMSNGLRQSRELRKKPCLCTLRWMKAAENPLSHSISIQMRYGKIFIRSCNRRGKNGKMKKLQSDGKRISTIEISWCLYWGTPQWQFETIFENFGGWQLLEESRSFTGNRILAMKSQK